MQYKKKALRDTIRDAFRSRDTTAQTETKQTNKNMNSVCMSILYALACVCACYHECCATVVDDNIIISARLQSFRRALQNSRTYYAPFGCDLELALQALATADEVCCLG
eukprot:SAG11_NODE_25726_length_354_cov_170.847059_1_plen_108_part_01